MNDLESKLRSLTFRELPPGWRGLMVGAATAESRWRTWLAPHPAAWAALAAIWFVLGVISQTFERPSSTATMMTPTRSADAQTEPTLFAFQLSATTKFEPPL